MMYLPPFRRFLFPAIILLTLILFYRSKLLSPTSLQSFVIHPPPPLKEGIRVPIANLKAQGITIDISNNDFARSQKYFYKTSHSKPLVNSSLTSSTNTIKYDFKLDILTRCPRKPNPHTNHVRLPIIIQNISHVPSTSTRQENRAFWNPTIISLPYWSKNQYLVVSRIVTGGNYHGNVLCEANVCYTGANETFKPGELPCTTDDLQRLGPAGGMRCASTPVYLSVPPTPAEKCQGNYASFVDVPGFHDPRIFWSGKGEPLMMMNTQYVCICIL